jgi:hypothetical protein
VRDIADRWNADDPQDVVRAQPTVAAGDGLVRDAQHLGDPAERRPTVQLQRMNQPTIKLVADVVFHHHSLLNVEINELHHLRVVSPQLSPER